MQSYGWRLIEPQSYADQIFAAVAGGKGDDMIKCF